MREISKFKNYKRILIMILIIIASFVNISLAENEVEEDTKTETQIKSEVNNDNTNDDKESDEKDGETEEIIWTDFTNAKILICDNEDMFKSYYLKVENVDFTTNVSEIHSYYVFTSNNSTKPEIGNTKYEIQENATTTLFNDSKYGWRTDYINDIIEKNGENLYIWIIETVFNDKYEIEIKEVLSGKQISKPQLNKIGSRIKCYFFDDYTGTFLYEVYGYNSKRNIDLKIGKVTDKNILLSIKNGEYNCLEQLMKYAKTATSIYKGTVPLGRSGTITDKMDLAHEEYYYVYMKLDDENGTYREVEDISLYQAYVSDTIGRNLFDYLSNDFKWNLSESEPVIEDKIIDNTISTIPLPNAGKITKITRLIAILVLAIISIVYFRKYRKNRDIR